jgi:hypothetical protein
MPVPHASIPRPLFDRSIDARMTEEWNAMP